ncbi:MAG: hypothetical protein RLZZ347_714 [Candidatus Parcubacteria bacterium]|jgi:hypothetical protein
MARKSQDIAFERFLDQLREMMGVGWKAQLEKFEIQPQQPVLRLRPPSGGKFFFCPVTAVVRHRIHREFPSGAVTSVSDPERRAELAKVCLVSARLAYSIALAADKGTLGHRRYNRSYRRRLLKVCGLRESTVVKV